MAGWIHLIFYSMMTYISGMKPVCMGREIGDCIAVFSTFQLNIDFVHLNGGLPHGVFYYLNTEIHR